MIITCPECATRHVIAAEEFDEDGRQMTCGACGAEWFLLGPSSAANAVQTVNIDLSRDAPLPPSRALARPRRPLPRFDERDAMRRMADAERLAARRRGGDALLGGAVVAMAAVIGAFAALAATVDFTTAPSVEPSIETASIAGGVGALALGTSAGVVFVDHGFDLVRRPEGPALEVWGRVANNGPDEAVAPTIEIVSRDSTEGALQRWTAHPERRVLAPGESTRFTSRMMHPLGPVYAVDLALSDL